MHLLPLQLLPRLQGRAARREQEGLYDWLEAGLESLHLPGRPCLLRAVCEVAGAGGLQDLGLGGRLVQALLLMEHSEGEEGLTEYMVARARGRRRAGCREEYSCPASLPGLVSRLGALGGI